MNIKVETHLGLVKSSAHILNVNKSVMPFCDVITNTMQPA